MLNCGAAMPELTAPYLLIQNALTEEDVDFLRRACKRHLHEERIPCYVLINDLGSPTYMKIKEALQQSIGETIYYLNDFYIYTDTTFKTNWHMDTELFALDCAINAWILLSPNSVEDPLGFIDQINDSSERSFHSVKIDGDKCTFGNYCTGDSIVSSLAAIEATQIHTPRIEIGDILVLNPKRFHKTNCNTSKHALAFKFVLKGKHGFLSRHQVNSFFWPEVDIFNRLVKAAPNWDAVVDGIRCELRSEAGRKQLSAGFYPNKFDLYRQMAATL